MTTGAAFNKDEHPRHDSGQFAVKDHQEPAGQLPPAFYGLGGSDAQTNVSDRLPDDATWDDFVNAHGGPEATGWWVSLDWDADPGHSQPVVIGPYPSLKQAEAAMQGSLLIDDIAEETKRDEILEDICVRPEPASIASMHASHGQGLMLIDPGDPNHFGQGQLDESASINRHRTDREENRP